MKNARHLGKAILILALLASVTGCFSYAAFVSTTPKLGSERALTAEELDALLVAIRAKLTTMGMIEHPRLEWKKQIADESPESKYRLLDAYIVGPDSDFYGRYRVSVLQKKEDGAVLVLIQNPSSFRATSATKALQSGLEDVLAKQFPQSKVTITHEVRGPSIPE